MNAVKIRHSLMAALVLALGIFSGVEIHAAVPKKPIVFAHAIVPIDLYDTLSYPARAEAKVNAAILADADGVVTRIHTPLGKALKRGETVLTIQQTDPIYKYAPVAMRTPVAGIVSSLDVSEGSQVSKGQKLASVTNPKNLRLVVEVPAQDLMSVSAGMTAELQIPAFDQVIAVKVKGISPSVDVVTGTASADLEPVNAKDLALLRPGVIGKVTFKANLRKGLSVSEEALVYRNGSTYLRVIENGKSKNVAVVLGRKSRGNVEVLKGLSSGALVIERASSFVGDGDEVDVQKPEGQSETKGT